MLSLARSLGLVAAALLAGCTPVPNPFAFAAAEEPDVGAFTYYAPWGNLAIFYRDFGYAVGLVELGRISSGVERLARARDGLVVRVEAEPE